MIATPPSEREAAPHTELTDADVFAALRKTWQPVCLSRDLRARKIISYTLLNEDLVIADLPDGILAAVDLCPHRGAKFGLGAVVDGRLQCPYHGWEFDCAGACAKVPSLIDPRASLEKARLRTFQARDRYGFIWVKLDAEELAPLPDVPEYEDAAWTYVVPDPMRFGTGFRREIDNYLDMSHFAFAHKHTLGVAARGQITDITITHYDDGFQMDAPFPVLENPDNPPGKLQQSHHRRQRCFLPNFTTIRQTFHDGDERVLVHVPSPNTHATCTVFWALAISPGFDGPPAGKQIEFAIRVLDEDRVMVENQRPLEVPIGPEDSVMVPADRLANTYKAALREFVSAHREWVSARDRGLTSAAAPPLSRELEPVTILYGSQTGTAERLANAAARTLKRAAFAADVRPLYDADPAALRGNILVLASTCGNGEPPDNARAFYDALFERDDLDLTGVRFAVLALGDRTYANFCQCGREIDERLEALGGRRLMTRVDCDVDVDAPFAGWVRDVQHACGKGERQDVVALVEDDLPPGLSASRPLDAYVVENRLLSRVGSEKETRHYEVDVSGAGLAYAPGDALGVLPTNSPEMVDAVLALLGERAALLTASGRTLGQALLTEVELRRPSFALVGEVSRRAGDAALAELAASPDGRESLARYAAAHDVIDLLARPAGPARLTAGELLRLCDRLRPRLYSIASSPRVHPDSIHLTVATVRYLQGERTRHGAASTFLADRVRRHTPVPVYLHRNPHFRLPADPAADVIMVGPGAGVAPFRAFLYDREAAGAAGRNWLFFGDQRAAADFLYEEELARWRDTGLLDRLDTAFSRDEANKVYVQDRMREQSAALFDWIERGATLYVCGDSRRMAHDVDHALHEIVAARARCSPDEAREYVKRLQKDGRYKRDVY